jgi:hypothetical protein
MAVSSPRLPIGSSNFYELLDLPPFEPDGVKIQSRLREKAREFRKYQVGPYAAHAEACLNRLAQARQCLLDSQQKSRYDEQLRSQFDLPPLTVRASLPPEANGSETGVTASEKPGIVARGLNLPRSVWHSLQQMLTKPQSVDAARVAESPPASDGQVPATDEPPPDAPWVTVPVSESGPVSQAS